MKHPKPASRYSLLLLFMLLLAFAAAAQPAPKGGTGPGATRSLGGLLQLTLSPNPARERLLVSGKLAEAGPVNLTIIAHNGSVVYTAYTLQGAGAFRRYIPLDGLAAGAYWLRLSSGSGEESRSFIKQ
ncbi:MAG: T9SS type A sorting domain-containing protein [Chitinophagaceae bacterium]|nr:MAG: T9SS type A sorting domain-containing protein [Chitinophagaceae bacterium]